ncbi:hypothetical protein NQ176_g9941 [Zarea fungicola]|uniref:Uncharacterized protein n=1 Tax=Zarea fungicola TaxID=93591 RepID=A0ACC1MJ92_9HYPO|nr:hypothetical protein NQ176_g9941 [Lecanicillium fungicola]
MPPPDEEENAADDQEPAPGVLAAISAISAALSWYNKIYRIPLPGMANRRHYILRFELGIVELLLLCFLLYGALSTMGSCPRVTDHVEAFMLQSTAGHLLLILLGVFVYYLADFFCYIKLSTMIAWNSSERARPYYFGKLDFAYSLGISAGLMYAGCCLFLAGAMRLCRILPLSNQQHGNVTWAFLLREPLVIALPLLVGLERSLPDRIAEFVEMLRPFIV